MDLTQARESAEEKVTLVLGEVQASIDIPMHHARLLGSHKYLLDSNVVTANSDTKTFFIPEVFQDIAQILVSQLERVYRHSKHNDMQALEAIKADFNKLDGNTLVNVLKTTDCLDILCY